MTDNKRNGMSLMGSVNTESVESTKVIVDKGHSYSQLQEEEEVIHIRKDMFCFDPNGINHVLVEMWDEHGNKYHDNRALCEYDGDYKVGSYNDPKKDIVTCKKCQLLLKNKSNEGLKEILQRNNQILAVINNEWYHR
jgi:hypothetical protein